MSRKYIRQQILQDFVFPNNEVSQYDVDEIVHDINDNCVSGTVSNFVAFLTSNTGMTIYFDSTWSLNGAEPWIRNSNALGIWSLHMLSPDQDYYKPWRVVSSRSFTPVTATTYSALESITITASQCGLTEFINGTYYFEVRFIGHRCVYPVCVNVNLSVPTPTPTPTITPTQTITPTVSGAKSLEIWGRDVDATRQTLTLFYSVNGGGAINVPGYTGAQLPASCTNLYTITGLTEFDSVEFGTSISCVMNGNGNSSSCPSSSGSLTTYTFIVDASSIQQVALTIDSGTIP